MDSVRMGIEACEACEIIREREELLAKIQLGPKEVLAPQQVTAGAGPRRDLRKRLSDVWRSVKNWFESYWGPDLSLNLFGWRKQKARPPAPPLPALVHNMASDILMQQKLERWTIGTYSLLMDHLQERALALFDLDLAMYVPVQVWAQHEWAENRKAFLHGLRQDLCVDPAGVLLPALWKEPLQDGDLT